MRPGRGTLEWMAIPKSFVLAAGALHQARFALGALIVDEAIMMALAPLSPPLQN